MKRSAPPLVVHVIYALGTGGLENGLVNIINRAAPERYRHAIVCLTRSGDFARRLCVPGIEVISLDKRPGHDLGLYWRLWRTLWRLRPAIVHTRNLAALEMQVIARLLPGVRRVHGEHGRDIYDIDGSNRRYRALRKTVDRVVDRYIAVSEDLRRWLVDAIGIAPRRVVQIYNGVDLGSFFPRQGARPDVLPPGFLPADGVLVGTVGRLAEVKDQRSLLEAMARLVHSDAALGAGLRLVLVGDGPLYGALEQAARDLGIRDRVWLAGDRDDVPDILRAMDLFVLPSLAEGISNTILEAMACGLPVVATRTGGNPELVIDGDNGRLVPVSDPATLAATLHELIDDADGRRRMGERARARVAGQFNWDTTVESYLSVYDALLDVGGAR